MELRGERRVIMLHSKTSDGDACVLSWIRRLTIDVRVEAALRLGRCSCAQASGFAARDTMMSLPSFLYSFFALPLSETLEHRPFKELSGK